MGAVCTFQEGIWGFFSCFSQIPYQETVLSIGCHTFAFPDFPICTPPLGCCRALWDSEQGGGKVKLSAVYDDFCSKLILISTTLRLPWAYIPHPRQLSYFSLASRMSKNTAGLSECWPVAE